MDKINLVGKRFGRLLVSGETPDRPHIWDCICDCGNSAQVDGSNLRRGVTKSCGCLAREKAKEGREKYWLTSEKRAYEELGGKRFGRLTPNVRVQVFDSKGRKRAKWECGCDCGNKTTVGEDALKRGLTQSCGCLHREVASFQSFRDLTGKRFGRLTVICLEGQESTGIRLWRVSCDCGKESIIRGAGLTSALTQSCGCLQREVVSLPVGFSRRNALLSRYKTNAATRNLDWRLTDEEFFALIKQNCHYCGVPPCTLQKSKRFVGTLFYNGVDRKDNSRGYEFGNTVSACKRCNYAKGTMEYKEFLEYLKRVGKYQLEINNIEISV